MYLYINVVYEGCALPAEVKLYRVPLPYIYIYIYIYIHLYLSSKIWRSQLCAELHYILRVLDAHAVIILMYRIQY